MPLDPNIPLSIKSVNFGGLARQVFEDRAAAQQRRGQAETRQRQNTLLDLQASEKRQDIRSKGLASDALKVQGFMEAGDFDAAGRFMSRNTQLQFEEMTVDPSVSDADRDAFFETKEELIQLLKLDPKKAKQLIDSSVNNFARLGIIAPLKKSGRGEYSKVVHIAVDGEVKPFLQDVREPDPTKALTPIVIGGKRVTSVKDPRIIGASAEAKERGKVTGKERETAKINLPKIRSNASAVKGVVDKILAHPAFESVVGAPSVGKVTQFIPGTPEAGFRSLQKQLKGKQFVQQYQDVLKGGGQITEIEGEKATEAYSRMTEALSEEEFREAADEFKIEVDRLVTLAEQRAGTSEIKFLGFE